MGEILDRHLNAIQKMSIKGKTISYGVFAIIIAVGVIFASTLVVPASVILPTKSQSTSLTTNTSQDTSTMGGAGAVPFIIQLTDPPIVPTGTQWLSLTYTNVGLNLSQGAQSRWFEANATGTVNLMELVNVSTTIAVADIPNGSVANQIRFGIGLVQIDVNSVISNVTTVHSNLLVPIAGGAKVQNLTSALLDLTPKVVEITNGGTSAPIFLLVPSATAIVRQSSEVTPQQKLLGIVTNVTSADRSRLDDARGNVSIVSSSLSVSGEVTSFSITITNVGNVSVVLAAIRIQGKFSAASYSSTTPSTCQTSTTTGSDDATTTTSCSGHEPPEVIEHPNEVVFVATGASLVPVSGGVGSNSTSLVLAPGQTFTLSFSGIITLSQGDQGGRQSVVVLPSVGTSYSIHAEFSNDAKALVQVNAT